MRIINELIQECQFPAGFEQIPYPISNSNLLKLSSKIKSFNLLINPQKQSQTNNPQSSSTHPHNNFKSMRQKQNPSNLEKKIFQAHQISFKQTIQKIELSALKSTLQNKFFCSIKNKLKEQRLDRIKIIPPSISPTDRQNLFRSTDSFTDSGSFKHSKLHSYKRDTTFNDLDQLFQRRPFQLAVQGDEIARKQQAQRKSYEVSTNGFQKHKLDQLKQRKFKEKWKHSFRKDEMNVLRYSTSSPVETKFYKTSDIGKMLYTMIHVGEKQTNDNEGAKMMICEKHSLHANENKQNIELKEDNQKEEKRNRLNVKKNKTSLLLKRPLLL